MRGPRPPRARGRSCAWPRLALGIPASADPSPPVSRCLRALPSSPGQRHFPPPPHPPRRRTLAPLGQRHIRVGLPHAPAPACLRPHAPPSQASVTSGWASRLSTSPPSWCAPTRRSTSTSRSPRPTAEAGPAATSGSRSPPRAVAAAAATTRRWSRRGMKLCGLPLRVTCLCLRPGVVGQSTLLVLKKAKKIPQTLPNKR